MHQITTTELRGKMQRNEKGILVNTLPQESFQKEHIPKETLRIQCYPFCLLPLQINLEIFFETILLLQVIGLDF